MSDVLLDFMPGTKPYLWFPKSDGESVLTPEGYTADGIGHYAFKMDVPQSTKRVCCYGGYKLEGISLFDGDTWFHTPDVRELELLCSWKIVRVIFLVEDFPAKLSIQFE